MFLPTTMSIQWRRWRFVQNLNPKLPQFDGWKPSKDINMRSASPLSALNFKLVLSPFSICHRWDSITVGILSLLGFCHRWDSFTVKPGNPSKYERLQGGPWYILGATPPSQTTIRLGYISQHRFHAATPLGPNFRVLEDLLQSLHS